MRLTMRTSDGEAYWSDTKGGGWRPSSIHSRAALEKLAAYEDTGFEPDEIDFCLSGAISPQEAKERYEAHKKRYDEWLAWKQAEEQGRLAILPYRVGDLFWAVAYSDPRVIHVRLYQVTYHYKDGWVLWVENIDNENDWWKVPLEAFEAWSCFDSYEKAESALKGESKDV